MGKYYCRIILKDTQDGRLYFQMYNRMENDKRYTFLMRADSERLHKKIDDFYAICDIGNITIKIKFSEINTI